MFCIHHILKKKWEYSLAVYQLFIDFMKLKVRFESGVSSMITLNLQHTAGRQTFVWPILY